MGFESLYVVNPVRFPDPQADWRAAGAIDVVRNARVCSNVREAIADCGIVAGTSARERHIPWVVKSLSEFATELADQGSHSKPLAILFGREDNGLTNDELSLCNFHIRIPSSQTYGSLNLAMAVQVVAYELFKNLSEPKVKSNWDRKHASNQEIQGMIDHLDQVLNEVGFFDHDAPRTAFTRFQRMFARIQLDETEVQIMRGMLTHIQRKIP